MNTSSSAEVALAYGNRSAVLYYLGQYEDCIADISLAKHYGYPEEGQYKLDLRALKCHARLGQMSEAERSECNFCVALRSIAAHRDHFVGRLSICPSIRLCFCPVVTLSW